MSGIDDKLIASISQPVTEQPQAQEPNPVMEQQPTPVVDTPTPAPEMVAPVEAPVTETPVTPEPVDVNKIIAELSGGQFTDVENFKQALPKFNQFDTISTEKETLSKAKTELEQKLQEQAFANDYVKTLNDLVKSGATADQLKSFQAINNIGDINELSPIDAKVAKLVLIDGYRESVARKMVTNEFQVEDYEEGSDEREIIQEKLRVSSEADKQFLSKYKADLSAIDNSAKENQRLQELAAVEQHKQLVNTHVPQIANSVQGMGELSFKPKDGDEVKIKFDYPEDFKATIGERLTNFFMDGTTPVTQENVELALRHVNAVYLDENFPKIAQKIWADAESATWEKAVNKYENRSGLPTSPEPQVVQNQQNAEMNSFLRGLVGKS